MRKSLRFRTRMLLRLLTPRKIFKFAVLVFLGNLTSPRFVTTYFPPHSICSALLWVISTLGNITIATVRLFFSTPRLGTVCFSSFTFNYTFILPSLYAFPDDYLLWHRTQIACNPNVTSQFQSLTSVLPTWTEI